MSTTFLRRAVWRSQAPALLAGTAALPSLSFSGDSNTGFWSPAADTVAVSTGGSERVRVTTAGSLGLGWPVTDGFWGNQAGTAARQTITYSSNSTSINTAGKGLVVVNNDLTAGNLSSLVFGTWNTDATPIAVASVYSVNTDVRANTFTTGALAFATVTSGGVLTERMRLDAAGNLGLGVTPSAWGTAGSLKALQVGNVAAVTGDTQTTRLRSNVFTNASSIDTFIANGFATDYAQNAGRHLWFTSTTSGTAGTAITFTQAMTLNASGNLGIGIAAPLSPIHVLKGAAGDDVAQFLNAGGYGVRVQAQTGGSGTNTMLYTAAGESLALGTANTERVRVKSGGQVRFVPLAAAPTTNVEDGDVYYNSGTNKLQVRAGGVWVDLH